MALCKNNMREYEPLKPSKGKNAEGPSYLVFRTSCFEV